jgi:hypothetical protein
MCREKVTACGLSISDWCAKLACFVKITNAGVCGSPIKVEGRLRGDLRRFTVCLSPTYFEAIWASWPLALAQAQAEPPPFSSMN